MVTESLTLTQRSLDRTGVSLSSDDVSALAEQLASRDAPEVLLFARTGIDNAGAKLLARGIAQNSTARKIYLNANSIGPAGVTALCEALAKHRSVESINLGGNPIGAEGAAALSSLVVAHGGIKTLVLDDCGLDSGDLTQLEGCLRSHDCGLGMLSLWHNHVTPELRSRWEGLVQGHHSLVSIDLPEPIVNMTMAAPSTAQGRG